MTNHTNTRRGFLTRAGLGAAAIAAPSLFAADKARRPNIIICLADDQTWFDCGAYGGKQVQTPNIDSLARDGMRFDYAFTSTAMCAPTRSQLYTGLFPIRNGAYPNHSSVRPGTTSLPHYLKPLGYRVALAGKTHVKPKESFPFDYLKGTPAAVAEYIDADRDKPFCVVFASHNPHSPYQSGDIYDPAKVELPPYFVDTPKMREMFADYLNEITLLDGEIGEVMDIIEERKLTNDTLFIYTSEQGSGFPFAKWTCYDSGLHVGLIARWPGHVKAGSDAQAMVHYVDVTPTLVDLAGGDPIEGLDGRSIAPVLLGKKDKHRDVVFGVHTTRGIINGNECYAIRSIRTRSHQFIMNLNHDEPFTNAATALNRPNIWASWLEAAETDPKAAALVDRYQNRPAEEFYDLRKDPRQLNNIADDPENKAMIDGLRKQLLAWMEEQGDKGAATEMEAGGRKKSSEPKAKGGKNATGKVSDKTSFNLKQGDALSGADRPDIGKKVFTLNATIDADAPDGVIVAQGAAAYGYALYVLDGKLAFTVSQGHKPATITAAKPLGSGKKQIVARLSADAVMTLSVDGQEVASGKARQLLGKTPTDGLQVGDDTGNPVIDYKGSIKFKGKVVEVTLEIGV